tara:strand:- start:1178 stop:1411 length:234 start_codon:yes stop_codon:yes gene_type:complete
MIVVAHNVCHVHQILLNYPSMLYALQEVASMGALGQEKLTESNENRYPQTKQKKSQTHYDYEFEQTPLVDMYIPRVL